MKYLLATVILASTTFGAPDFNVRTIDIPKNASFTPALLSLSEILALIQAVAQKHNVPAEFITSIVAAESNFNPFAVSPKGAIGLMQLMPATAREYGGDPNNPAENIEAGTRYLRFLIQRYRNSRHPLRSTIAAYNAGPSAVDRYRGVPPFRETRGYVTRVLAFLRRFRERAPSSADGRSGDDLRGAVQLAPQILPETRSSFVLADR